MNFRIIILGLFIILIPFDNFRLFPFSLSTLMGMLYIIASLNVNVLYRKEFVWQASPILISCIIFFLSALYFIQDTSLQRGSDSLFNAIILYVVLTVITLQVSSDTISLEYFRTIVVFLFLSTFIASLTGLFELISVVVFKKFPFGTTYIQPLKWLDIFVLRIRGTYFDPNYFSFIPLLCLACTNFLFAHRILRFVLNVLLIILILATFSRMGIVCLLLYYSVWSISRRMLVYIILPTSLVFSPLIIYQVNRFFQSLVDFNPKSVDHRMIIFRGALKMIESNPIFGYGFNVKTPSGFETHNTYLQILIYGGLLGIISIFYPLIITLVNILKVRPLENEDAKIKRFLLSLTLPFFVVLFFLSYLTIKFFWIYVMLLFLGKNILYVNYEQSNGKG